MIYYRKTLFGCGPKLTAVQFERATYALEEFAAAQKTNNFNDLYAYIGTV